MIKRQIDPLALAAISNLQKPDQPDLLEMVAQKFLSESPKAIDSIREALEINDVQQVCFAAHSLKSNSAYLGVTVMSDRCRKLEDAALQENFAACAVLGDDLEALFDGCRVELDLYLGKLT